MKSLVVHYMNKFPGGHVRATDDALDVYNAQNEHCVALRKNGAGQWADQSEAFGCKHCHCLSPIPKESRLWKEVGGKIVKDEDHETRKAGLAQFIDEGRIPSCEELKKKGFRFDEKHRVESRPAQGPQAL